MGDRSDGIPALKNCNKLFQKILQSLKPSNLASVSSVCLKPDLLRLKGFVTMNFRLEIDNIIPDLDRGYERIIADITLQDNASTSVAQIRLEVETDLEPLTSQLLPEVDANHAEMDQLREKIAQLEQERRSKDDQINRLSAENNRLTNELGRERDEKTRLAAKNAELVAMNDQKCVKISRTREMVGKSKTDLLKEQVELQIGNNNTEDVKISKFVNEAIHALEQLGEHLDSDAEVDGNQLTPV